jgi:hypothetical protein
VRAAAFNRRGGLRAAAFAGRDGVRDAALRDGARFRGFARAIRRGLAAFLARFAVLTPPLAFFLAIVPTPSATLTVLR